MALRTWMITSLLVFVMSSGLWMSSAFAQATDELVTVTVEGASKAESSVEATREIQAKAIADAAREQVIEAIGEKRYQKNKALVEGKIVRQAAKFVPFVNPGQAEKQTDGSWKMPVELKISAASLRKMILEAGLLNDAEGPASILPMVAFTDRVKGVSAHWWLGEERAESHKFINQLSRLFHETMQKEFARQGFHVIRPQGTQSSPLPEVLRLEKPAGPELAAISQFFHAPMVLKGDVDLRESRDLPGAFLCSVKLQIQHVTGNRTVAEVSRSFETDAGNMEVVVRSKMNSLLPEIAKDLAVQVLDVWQRGTLNANLMKLTVRGNLSPKQMNEFKSGLLKNVREVKGLKERMFERGQVVFELDYVGQAAQLTERVKAMQLQPFETRLAENTDKGLVLDVKTR